MDKKADKNPRVTCQMIADLANVSRATVRRVMRNDPYVKPEVRERVSNIIETYRYRPNTAAVALVRQRTSVKIGVISFSAADALYEDLNRGSRKAAEENGDFAVEVLYEFIRDTEGYEGVVNAIDSLIDRGIRGLAIMGIDVPEVREKLQQVQAQLPIVTYNTEISGFEPLCYVGQDPIRCGRTTADLMNRLLGGRGNVVVLANSMKVLAVARRIEAFGAKLAEYGAGMRIVAVLENESSNTRSFALLSELFAAGRKIDGIYVASGFGSDGVCRAMQAHGQNHIQVVTHDLLPYTIEHLKAGRIAFTIDQELFTQGYLPVELLAKYLILGEKPRSARIYTRIDIKTAENL